MGLKTGSKHTPTVIRLLTNASRKSVKTNEPKPTSVARKPDWLEGTAAEVWDEYAPQLIQLGLLTGVDVELFAAFCTLAATLRDTPEKMRPAHFGQLRMLSSCFGMSPAERTRFSAPAERSGSGKSVTEIR